MLQRILDLCVPLQDGVPADSRGYEMSLEYMRHRGTIAQWARQHKGLDPITLPNGGGFAREHVRRPSHNGNAIGAPSPYGSTMANGERAGGERPPEWFVVPYFYVDFRRVSPRAAVAAGDVQEALVCIKRTLDRFDILLINTGERVGLSDDLKSARGKGRPASIIHRIAPCPRPRARRPAVPRSKPSNCCSEAAESEISATETRFPATSKITPYWP